MWSPSILQGKDSDNCFIHWEMMITEQESNKMAVSLQVWKVQVCLNTTESGQKAGKNSINTICFVFSIRKWFVGWIHLSQPGLQIHFMVRARIIQYNTHV